MNAIYEIAQAPGWLADIIRSLFLLIDSFIYGFVITVYEAIKAVADIRELLSINEIVETLSSGLYSFLAVAMLFRFAFSILTMIADPDKIDDKNQGLSKLVTNAIITIILVVTVPTIFNYAYDVQNYVLENNIIEKFFRVVGGNPENSVASIPKTVFRIFFVQMDDVDESVNAAFDEFDSSGGFNTAPFNDVLKVTNSEGKLAIPYIYLISTAAGLFILWTFLQMAIEVAERSFKLFALQILSPIAVISYIDPSSASKGLFKRWVEECMKTYASLFTRLISISFIITILTSFKVNFSATGNAIVSLVLILGLLSFMVMAPKFIENVFGFKTEKTGVFGKKLLGAGLGIAGAAAFGLPSAIKNGHDALGAGEGFWKNTMSPLKNSIKQGAKTGFGGKDGGAGAKALWAGVSGAQMKKEIQGTDGYKKAHEAKKKTLDDGKAINAYKGYASHEKAVSNLSEDEFIGRLSEGRAIAYKGYSAEEKTAYRKMAASQNANAKTYSPDVAAKMNNKLERNFENTLKRNEFMQAKNSVAVAQSKYSSAVNNLNSSKQKFENEEAVYNTLNSKKTTSPSTWTAADQHNLEDAYNRMTSAGTVYNNYKLSVKAEEDAFTTAQGLATKLENEYDLTQKLATAADNALTATLESPVYREDAEKSKLVDRGKKIQ